MMSLDRMIGLPFYAESEFAFLNRSAWPTVHRIRQVLDDWFSRYPEEERAKLRSDFRLKIDSAHRAAFFELMLHELLLKLGCRITVHPPMGDTVTKRPDFLVQSQDGGKFYLEAVLATNESDKAVATQARINQVYDAIDKMDSPDFFIGMDVEGAPQTPPSAKAIVRLLTKQLASIDPKDIAETRESSGFAEIPHWPYEHDGWKIDFYPIPKSPKSRGKAGIGTIGIQSYGFHMVESREAIRRSLRRKAGRYGDLDAPYIIAVNTLDVIGGDQIDIMEALFGKEQYTVPFGYTGQSKEPTMTRVPDGLWTSSSGPQNTRVSAVLECNPIIPWNLPKAPVRLYHNPWAAKPYGSVLTVLPQSIPNKHRPRMGLHDGLSLGQIFDLPLNWPHD